MSINRIHNNQLIAERIDQKVTKLLSTGANDLEVFTSMAGHMDDFKTLMDTSSPADMDRLCSRYEGFYRYAKILEDIAEGVESGDIPVP